MTMTEPKRQDSDNNVSAGGETDYIDEIPVDLFLGNILSRLPLKSMAKCRCVSKLWSLIIRRRNNNLLFPIKPPYTPRIFFASGTTWKLLFFSSPQPQDPDIDLSLVLTRHHTKLGEDLKKICRPVRGLVCSQHFEDNHSWAVISNLITGEYVTTPKVRDELTRAVYCFGYDPIDNQFKVLRVSWYSCPTEVFKLWSRRYHVLTLGTGNGNLLWRKIQCCTLHYPLQDNGICIDGVLFYLAMVDDDKTRMMVCFNLRSEEFSFINVDTKIPRSSVLINYKGKLCVSEYIFSPNQLKFWVLEDAKKHKWSKHFYQLPLELMNEVLRPVGPVGMTGSGEFILCSIVRKNAFFIFYYHLESNTIKRVRVEDPVSDDFSLKPVHTFLNHVEDVELM